MTRRTAEIALEVLKKSVSNECVRHTHGVDLIIVEPHKVIRDLSGELFSVSRDIQADRASDYAYPFLKRRETMREFFKDDGLIVIAALNGSPLGMSFNKFTQLDAKNNLITVGFGIAKKHSLGVSILKITSLYSMVYSATLSRQESKRCFMANLCCDGKSLELVATGSRGTTYPLDGNEIRYEERENYRLAAEEAFNAYVSPCFPSATLCKNTNIVTSRKKEMGFHDSFSTSRHGSDVKYSSFIKNWIDDYSCQDILFVGLITKKNLESMERYFDQ